MDKLKSLQKKKNEKTLTLSKAEDDKSYLLKKISCLNGNSPELDTLKIKLQKKLSAIRNIKSSIRKLDESINREIEAQKKGIL